VKRSDRLNAVRRVIETERDGASQRLAQKQSSLAFAGNRLQELLQYREDYLSRFRKDAGAGLSGTRVRDYQTFLAKLDQAIKQQQSVLASARAEERLDQQNSDELSQRNFVNPHTEKAS
jgi:flagellar FliJ protein